MKTENIGIATAYIHGLSNSPTWDESCSSFLWNIGFSDYPAHLFSNLLSLSLGKGQKSSKELCACVSKKFQQAHIQDGDKVALIFHENSGTIRAISSIGRNCWVDLAHKFVCKKFNELGIAVNSLKVY